jgi:hypothetical protein
MIKELNPFALDAVFYGISLYDKNGFWKNAVKEFKKCKRKYNLRKLKAMDGFGKHLLKFLSKFAKLFIDREV